MIGVASNLFAPEDSVNTAMIVTVLGRIGEVDFDAFIDVEVKDLDESAWYANAVRWAIDSKIIELMEDYTAPADRTAMAAMLANFMKYKEMDVSQPEMPVHFKDAKELSDEDMANFQMLYHRNIIKGVGNDRLDPSGLTTRAQLAALLNRMTDYMKSLKENQ